MRDTSTRTAAAIWLSLIVAAGAVMSSPAAWAQSPSSTFAARPATTLSSPQIYQKTLRGTVYIEVPDQGSGSGWVLDAGKRLVITNHHVVGQAENVWVYFPAYKDGHVIPDTQHYVDNEKAIKGHVFDSAPGLDLAIIQLESMPPDATPMTLAPSSVLPGEAVYSLGGNPQGSAALWIFTVGTVRAVYHRTYRLSDTQLVDAQVVETSSPVNHGDSGGPVVNDRGELVAIVSAFGSQARLMTLFVDVSEIQKYTHDVTALLQPTTADEFMRRGNRYRETGRLDRALADFTEASRLDPKSAEAFASRGWVFTNKGDLDTAIGDFNEAIALDSHCADAFDGRGYAHALAGRYDEAIADFTQAIRFNHGRPSPYNNRGWAHQQKNELDLAVADFTRAIEFKADPLYFCNRADAYVAWGYVDAAIEDCTHALEVNNNYPYAWYRRAEILLNYKNNADQAIHDLSQAIDIDPNYASYFDLRCMAYQAKQRYQEALADVNEAIEIQPTLADAWFHRGSLFHFQFNNAQQALADYNEAIRLGPNTARYWNDRGVLYFDNGDMDRAISDFTTAISLAPGSATYYANRGNAYQRKGDTVRANADFEKARSIDVDSVPQAGQTQLQNRRYVKVVNNSGERIEMRIVFHTLTVNGDWAWYPADPDYGRYYTLEMAAGAETYLFLNDVKVAADEIVISAVGLETGGTWTPKYYRIAEEGGYQAAERADYIYTFNP